MITRAVFRTLSFTTRQLTQPYSLLDNSDFSDPFTKQFKISAADQLEKYQQYLIKHNHSLKNPHQKLRTEEERIIQRCLQQQRYTQIIGFLFNNSSLKLCNISTSPTLDSALAQHYQSLNLQLKKKAALSLISFREPQVFNLFKKQIEKQIAQRELEDIDVQSLLVYVYGQLINYKKLDFFCMQLAKKQINHKQAVERLYQRLSNRKYFGTYKTHLNLLITYLQLLLHPALNTIKRFDTQKKRSHLESIVEPHLQVLGYQNDRECSVNHFLVDFLLDKGQGKKVVLEVNGNYHYTLAGKLKGKQILRNLIINEAAPLRIVHHLQFLRSKGHRNKMAYITHLLTLNDVNWESKDEGFESGWQVSQLQKIVNYPSR